MPTSLQSRIFGPEGKGLQGVMTRLEEGLVNQGQPLETRWAGSAAERTSSRPQPRILGSESKFRSDVGCPRASGSVGDLTEQKGRSGRG